MTPTATIPTTPPATPTAGHTPSAVEYVRALSPEDKGDVLIVLLRELIEINNGGHGLIPIGLPEGGSLGYYVPPLAAAARAEAVLPKLTPEREVELERRLREPGIPIEDVIADLRARAAALENPSPGLSGPPA